MFFKDADKQLDEKTIAWEKLFESLAKKRSFKGTIKPLKSKSLKTLTYAPLWSMEIIIRRLYEIN